LISAKLLFNRFMYVNETRFYEISKAKNVPDFSRSG
jgi:hypothetical protein